MTAAFHPFPNLPAELRSCVWVFAHAGERATFSSRGRTIELYGYNQDASTIRVAVTRRFPTCFAVSREARYEVAKFEGGDWTKPIALYGGGAQQSAPRQFEIYFNFQEDTIFLSERFSELSEYWRSFSDHSPIQEYRLNALRSILDQSTLERLQNLMLSAMDSCIELLESFWMGEGLEVFKNGDFKDLTLVVDDFDYGACMGPILEITIATIWGNENDKSEVPLISGFYPETDSCLFYTYDRGRQTIDMEHDVQYSCYGICTIEAEHSLLNNNDSSSRNTIPQ